MTARRLFSNNVLGPAFDYKTGINLSFEALQDLAAMHDIRKDVRHLVARIGHLAARS